MVGTRFSNGGTTHTVTAVDPDNASGISVSFTPDFTTGLNPSTAITFTGVEATLVSANIHTDAIGPNSVGTKVTNLDSVNSLIAAGREVIYRSSSPTWTSATPPASLGNDEAFGIDNTGTGDHQAWTKVGGTWATTTFTSSSNPLAEIEATGTATNVRVQPSTMNANLTIGLKGTGDFHIVDLDDNDSLQSAVPLATLTKATWDGAQFVASVLSSDPSRVQLIHKRVIAGNNTTVRDLYGEFTSTALIIYANQDRSTTLLTQNYTG